jgi:hypothetical protein
VLFLVGGLLPVLLILYVRRYVRESPVFEITRDRRAAANRTADLLEIFSPARLPLRGAENLALSAIDRHHRNRRTIIGTTVRCCMLSIGALCGYYAILVWLPAFLTAGKLKVDGQYLAFLIIGSGAGYLVSAFFSDLDRLGWRGNFGLFAFLAMVLALPAFLVDSGLIVTWSYLLFVIIGSGVGYLVSALLSPLLGDRDLFGRRRNFVLFAIFAIAALFACTHFGDKDIIPKLDVRQSVIRGLAFPLGFFISGTFAGTGAFLTELFPTRMRGSGVGFTYNFGRGFVVLMLWLIPWVAVTDDGLGPSIGAFVLVAYGLVIIAALLIRETKGIALDTDVEEAQETVPAASTAAAP